MSGLLFDLHQGNDQRWRWFGIRPGSDTMIVSRRKWRDRSQASQSMTRFVQLLERTGN